VEIKSAIRNLAKGPRLHDAWPMERFFSKYAEWFYTLLRLVAGGLFMCHGLQKIFGVLATKQPAMFTQVWFGGVIELSCGALVAVGLFTRFAALLASGTMAVAYLQFHWKGQVGRNFWPIANGGEAAVLYCFVFLWIAAKGNGKLSLDGRRG